MIVSDLKSNLLTRFLKYVSFDTQSNSDSEFIPSTEKQKRFAEFLVQELREIGLENAFVDSFSYVYASLDANTKNYFPKIGFISHLDTSPDMSGENIKPRVIQNYDLNNIVLNEQSNIVLSVDEFPELANYENQTIICTDGNTLLGADDKAGIAEIVTVLEYLINNPEIEHGKICIAFTPDEEIGRGVEKFDLNKFDADYAYTVDGGELGELEYENFNAAKAKIIINGCNVHPGYAKGKMINANLISSQLISLLPIKERPETTDNYQGFYHLCEINSSVEKAELDFIIRDFDSISFAKRKQFLIDICNKINKSFVKPIVSIEIVDQYFNMKEIIENHLYVVDKAKKAMEKSGVVPKIIPIRGGTDGVQLSFLGLPCPNLFTGGHNFHSKYEFVILESMQKSVEVIFNIIIENKDCA